MILVKEIYGERGIKDQDHDLVRKAWTAEFEKVSRQLNITKIIHDTYVKEIARFHKKREDEERRKRELSEEKRLEVEIAVQAEIAQAEEERKKLEVAKRRKALVGLRASR